MLIVTGVIEIAPDGVETARAAALEMMTETRKEDGCIVYEFSQVIGSETRFRVYEEWQSEDHLKAHFQTPHMAVFRAALAGVGVVSRDVFTVAGGTKAPLG